MYPGDQPAGRFGPLMHKINIVPSDLENDRSMREIYGIRNFVQPQSEKWLCPVRTGGSHHVGQATPPLRNIQWFFYHR